MINFLIFVIFKWALPAIIVFAGAIYLDIKYFGSEIDTIDLEDVLCNGAIMALLGWFSIVVSLIYVLIEYFKKIFKPMYFPIWQAKLKELLEKI